MTDEPPGEPGPPTVEVSGELTNDEILPATADLQEAVGAPATHRDEPDEPEALEPRWSRRTTAIAGVALIGGIGLVALILLGRANAQHYLLTCTADHVSPEQGRAFPPWGSRPLVGPQWKAVPLPPNAECTTRETADLGELERLYLAVLVDRASTTLAGENPLEHTGSDAPVDTAAGELNQALLLARSPQSRDQRKEIQRLLGDVQYWRATARLHDASAALVDAARQFQEAAAAQPRHVTDAAAWAGFVKRLSDELHGGPDAAGARAPAPPIAPTTTAPEGTALPVEPGPATPPAAPPAAPVDAGIPTGGVLL